MQNPAHRVRACAKDRTNVLSRIQRLEVRRRPGAGRNASATLSLSPDRNNTLEDQAFRFSPLPSTKLESAEGERGQSDWLLAESVPGSAFGGL